MNTLTLLKNTDVAMHIYNLIESFGHIIKSKAF